MLRATEVEGDCVDEELALVAEEVEAEEEEEEEADEEEEEDA